MSELAKIDVQVGCLRTLIELQTGGPEFVEACRILLQHYDEKRRAYNAVKERMHFKRQLYQALPKMHTALSLVEGMLDEMESSNPYGASGNFFSEFNVR